ncbi:DUF1292 domain-containing protein [Clostridium sp. Marseille-P299]|uniref:DUF1292 domain-containing protein n=1 Tax=Clostridium sp. Marseille-P299 TaxID=1805477 RepID=UPI00082A5239|nr:DUF1292 domain-containing protein [Clostridium sp. Marseille-P299]
MENKNDNIVSFFTEDNEEVKFRVIEETKLNGVSYLLVTEDSEDEEEAYILKDISKQDDSEAIYDIVEDEKEINLIASIFEELLEDTDIISE